jgi:hypothetical protein
VEDAVRRGRGGRGLIYVNAVGNYFNVIPYVDAAGTDEINTRRLSMTIGASDFGDVPASYSEDGAPLTALAPSDDPPLPGLCTTASPNTYTDTSGFTSGAAANAAGVAALITRTRFSLSWRDVQEILHQTNWYPGKPGVF